MAEQIILSYREKLEQVGITPPKTSDLCQVIWNFVSKQQQVNQERVEEIIRLQKEYLGRRVFRVREPDKKGTVDTIRPMPSGSYFALTGLNPTFKPGSRFEVYVKWDGGKFSFINLSLVQICEDSPKL